MTKEDSLQLKGIAIMMMLWLHLFGTDQEILAETDKSIYLWDGEPLIFAMRKFGRMCVVLYTFLGGYGLAKVYQRCPNAKGFGIIGGMNNGKRLWNLFTNYWIVMLLFLIIATILKPDIYPGNATDITQNITALNSTYNDSLWFLFPYALLTLFASPIIRLSRSLRGMQLWFFITLALVVKIIAYNTAIPHDSWGRILLGNIISALGLFFMFFIGAIFANNSLIEKTVKWTRQQVSDSFIVRKLHIGASTVFTILLFGLFVGRVALGASTLIDPVYIILMIVPFLCIERPKWIATSLAYIGKHSTNIWFTHRYILVLTGTAITFFRFPIVILIALIAGCLACSYIINAIKKVTLKA